MALRNQLLLGVPPKGPARKQFPEDVNADGSQLDDDTSDGHEAAGEDAYAMRKGVRTLMVGLDAAGKLLVTTRTGINEEARGTGRGLQMTLVGSDGIFARAAMFVGSDPVFARAAILVGSDAVFARAAMFVVSDDVFLRATESPWAFACQPGKCIWDLHFVHDAKIEILLLELFWRACAAFQPALAHAAPEAIGLASATLNRRLEGGAQTRRVLGTA